MPEQHTILGGKVHVYKRPNSSLWQCSSYFAGKNRRTSTKEESLSKAKEIAEDWYLQLRGKLRAGEIKNEKTFREVSEQYLRECDIMTQGERNQAIRGGPTLAVERSPGTLLRKPGHLRDHRWKNPGIPIHDTKQAISEMWQATGPQHDAPRNRDAAPDLENSAAPRMARPASRFL